MVLGSCLKFCTNCLVTVGPLISQDQILQVMPSVALSLHLLCERHTEDSRWKSYMDILPDTYTTPLYFTTEDLKQLKGSPAQGLLWTIYQFIKLGETSVLVGFKGQLSSWSLLLKFSSTIPVYIVWCKMIVSFVASFEIWTFYLKIRISTYNGMTYR